MQVAGCRLALPSLAQQWHQCDSECIFVTLEIHLTTLFSEIFCFGDFFCDGTGRDKRTNGQTQGQTDFSRKILFQISTSSCFTDLIYIQTTRKMKEKIVVTAVDILEEDILEIRQPLNT